MGLEYDHFDAFLSFVSMIPGSMYLAELNQHVMIDNGATRLGTEMGKVGRCRLQPMSTVDEVLQ